MSALVRQTLRYRVEECLSWREAALKAGMSEAGIHKARLQPHVQALHEEMALQRLQEMEALKAPFKAKAFEEGMKLLTRAKSEAVRARMVEFFAGGDRSSGVNVAVQINNNSASGYEYAPPGAQIIEVSNNSSAHENDDSQENKGDQS